jgi:hypothetical protein
VLRFLAPIDPQAAGDRKILAARARAEVVESLAIFERGEDHLAARKTAR